MNKYEQRRQQLLQDPQVALGYRMMDAELQLLHMLETISQHRHMNEEIASLSSLANVSLTLETLIEVLSVLDVTADITIRPSQDGESPLKVAVEL